MFYLFAIGSMLGYSLQNALLGRHARNMDGLSLTFYRNASFVITLLPLLIGASSGEVMDVLSHWRLLLFGGVTGGIYLFAAFEAYRFLPVGIVSALTKALMTLCFVVAGWIWFGEHLSFLAILFMLLIVLGSILLGIVKNYHAHLSCHSVRSFVLVGIAAVFLTATNITPTVLSRMADPMISGYFWEMAVCLGAGVLVLLRWFLWRIPLMWIPPRQLFSIALCSSPTLIGTGCYLLATHIGPPSIVIAIGTSSLVFTSLLCVWLYREHLKFAQWIAIGVVLAGVIGLKFV